MIDLQLIKPQIYLFWNIHYYLTIFFYSVFFFMKACFVMTMFDPASSSERPKSLLTGAGLSRTTKGQTAGLAAVQQTATDFSQGG